MKNKRKMDTSTGGSRPEPKTVKNNTSADQRTLKKIHDTSIKHFGFVTTRPSRMQEYSWILQELEDHEGYICDVGCGISPLPIILAETSLIDTIDYWSEETNNEWGFINYHNINKSIRSYNVDFANYETDTTYCALYSISAIEHMPADTRRRVFKKAFDLLDDDGVFLITMDVTQGTVYIHNRNYGRWIEDNHGTIADVVNELHDAGFEAVLIFREEFKGQGQDVLFIKATK